MNAKTNTRDLYWFLDSVAGWREASREHLALTKPDGYLRLDPLPGAASLLLDADKQAAEFKCPSALSVDACGRILVVDAAKNLVKQIDLDRQSIETIPSIGAELEDARALREPRGVATLRHGGFVVADTGNHRVKVFSPRPFALLQDWGASDAGGRPIYGQGEKMFHSPWAVAADRCGTIYIADRGNRRIQRIASDGTPLPAIRADMLATPTRLALGPGNVLAVVDPTQLAVFIFAPGRQKPWRVCPTQKGLCSVAFDCEGKLYIGDTIGRIHVFEPDPATDKYRLVGAGDTGISGEMVDLTWDKSRKRLVAIIHENFNGQRQRLWTIDPAASSAQQGRFVIQTLDSNIERCQWHRVLLNATVPVGTSLQVDSFTSDQRVSDEELNHPDFKQWTPCLLAGDNDPERLKRSGPGRYRPQQKKMEPRVDCLVQSGPGQHLRLRLTYKSNGRESPEVKWIKVFYPRVSYLQYLPAVYQEDDESRLFLDKFLSIFQSDFDEFDRTIDRLWQLFDPNSVPREHLQWLASWLALAINPKWPECKLRSMLKGAFESYLRRGTIAALEQAVADYTGIQAKALEHFRLRRWPVLYDPTSDVETTSQKQRQYSPKLSVAARLDGTVPLWSRDFYKRLQVTSYSQVGYFQLTGRPEPLLEPLDWGAHEFTVFFTADPYCVDEVEREVSRVIEREKPAHTTANLCPVLPRMRVGVQATLGVDSVVGGISNLVLNQLATLGYDSILASSPDESAFHSLGSTPHPRTGVTTKLL